MVTIHKFDCPEVEKTELDRRIPTRWSSEAENHKLTIVVEIIFRDKKGILMQLTESFYNANLNINGFTTENIGDGMVRDIFTLESEDDDYYLFERLETRLKFEIPEIVEMNLLDMK